MDRRQQGSVGSPQGILADDPFHRGGWPLFHWSRRRRLLRQSWPRTFDSLVPGSYTTLHVHSINLMWILCHTHYLLLCDRRVLSIPSSVLTHILTLVVGSRGCTMQTRQPSFDQPWGLVMSSFSSGTRNSTWAHCRVCLWHAHCGWSFLGIRTRTIWMTSIWLGAVYWSILLLSSMLQQSSCICQGPMLWVSWR